MLRQCSYDRHTFDITTNITRKKQGIFIEPIYVPKSQNKMQHYVHKRPYLWRYLILLSTPCLGT